MSNVINITIDMQQMHDDYPQGTTTIPSTKFYEGDATDNKIPLPSYYIDYEIASWDPDKRATAKLKNGVWKLKIPMGDTFTWKVVDKSGFDSALTLMSPLDRTAFSSETSSGDLLNEYTCTMTRNKRKKGKNTECTLAIMCVKNSQRWLYAWDPSVEPEGGQD